MKILWLFVGSLLLLSAGCTPAVLIPRGVALLSPTESASFRNKLQSRSQEIESLKLFSKTSISSSEGIQTLRHLLLFKPQGNKLRLEAFPVNGFLSLMLWLVEGNSAVIVENGRAVQKMDREQLEKRFLQQLQTPLSLEELGFLLVGRIPLGELAGINGNFSRTNLGEIILESNGRIWIFDPVTELMTQFFFQRPLDEVLLLKIKFDNYQPSSKTLLPRELKFDIFPINTQVHFSLDRAESNVIIDDRLFSLE